MNPTPTRTDILHTAQSRDVSWRNDDGTVYLAEDTVRCFFDTDSTTWIGWVWQARTHDGCWSHPLPIKDQAAVVRVVRLAARRASGLRFLARAAEHRRMDCPRSAAYFEGCADGVSGFPAFLPEHFAVDYAEGYNDAQGDK